MSVGKYSHAVQRGSPEWGRLRNRLNQYQRRYRQRLFDHGFSVRGKRFERVSATAAAFAELRKAKLDNGYRVELDPPTPGELAWRDLRATFDLPDYLK